MDTTMSFNDFFAKYQAMLHGYIARRVNDSQAIAEDLTQEVFLAAFQGWERFVGPENKRKAWLYAIANHKIQDYHRQQYRLPATAALDDPAAEIILPAEPNQRPDLLLSRQQAVCSIQHEVAKLTPLQQSVFFLRQNCWSFQEIAQQLRRQPAAVKVCYHHVKKQLKTLAETIGALILVLGSGAKSSLSAKVMVASLLIAYLFSLATLAWPPAAAQPSGAMARLPAQAIYRATLPPNAGKELPPDWPHQPQNAVRPQQAHKSSTPTRATPLSSEGPAWPAPQIRPRGGAESRPPEIMAQPTRQLPTYSVNTPVNSGRYFFRPKFTLPYPAHQPAHHQPLGLGAEPTRAFRGASPAAQPAPSQEPQENSADQHDSVATGSGESAPDNEQIAHENTEIKPLTWSKIYGGVDTDMGVDVKQTRDGGFIVTGRSLVNANELLEADDIFLLRLDQHGQRLWSTTFGRNDRNWGYISREITTGGFVVVGNSYSNTQNRICIQIFAIDQAGHEIWRQTFGDGKINRVNAIMETADSGFLIIGDSDAAGKGNSDLLVLKIDQSGQEVWKKLYGGGQDDSGAMVWPASDGGFVISGFQNAKSLLRIDSGGAYIGGDFWLVKTDSAGNLLWERTLAGEEQNLVYQAILTHDGGFLAITSDRLLQSFQETVSITKIDANGQECWRRHYFSYGTNPGYAVHETSAGEFIITGKTVDARKPRGYSDLWLMKIDAAGREVWNKTLGGPLNDWGTAIEPTADGGLIVSGVTLSFGAWKRQGDIWILKTDAEGNSPAEPE